VAVGEAEAKSDQEEESSTAASEAKLLAEVPRHQHRNGNCIRSRGMPSWPLGRPLPALRGAKQEEVAMGWNPCNRRQWQQPGTPYKQETFAALTTFVVAPRRALLRGLLLRNRPRLCHPTPAQTRGDTMQAIRSGRPSRCRRVEHRLKLTATASQPFPSTRRTQPQTPRIARALASKQNRNLARRLSWSTCPALPRPPLAAVTVRSKSPLRPGD